MDDTVSSDSNVRTWSLDDFQMTGLVLRAAKRLQINIDLKQSDLI